jgi:hypothetical protein
LYAAWCFLTGREKSQEFALEGVTKIKDVWTLSICTASPLPDSDNISGTLTKKVEGRQPSKFDIWLALQQKAWRVWHCQASFNTW